MKKRILESNGLVVSALGMGCMNLSFGTGKAVALSENDINDIDNAFSAIPVMGKRYPAHLQQRVGK